MRDQVYMYVFCGNVHMCILVKVHQIEVCELNIHTMFNLLCTLMYYLQGT